MQDFRIELTRISGQTPQSRPEPIAPRKQRRAEARQAKLPKRKTAESSL
ncbi:MAG TPA: hypothetical protein V6C95_23590 [Coleofasciculaceae cyanobacterium]